MVIALKKTASGASPVCARKAGKERAINSVDSRSSAVNGRSLGKIGMIAYYTTESGPAA
jgi:hypothetical protein